MKRSPKYLSLVALFALVGLPILATADSGPVAPSGTAMSGVTGIVQLKYYLANPSQAPAEFAAALGVAHSAPTTAGALASARPAPYGDLFNRDSFGLPQNEESVSVCHRDPRVIIGGTNDYRGLLDPQGNFTGWEFSDNGGRSVTNEGLLPPVTAAGTQVPSGGDPAFVADDNCDLFGASLNYIFSGPSFSNVLSTVGLYRTTPATLRQCPQGAPPAHPSCWPTRRNVEVARSGHFLDKEWANVGNTGDGRHVWVGYSDASRFDVMNTEHASEIHMVRCSTDLSRCTAPIKISGTQKIAEYVDITIGPDHRTYATWSEFVGSSFTAPAERGWLAVAEPGSTHFSPPRLVQPTFTRILRGHPIGKIHSNDFRLGGTMFFNTVRMVHGRPRVYVVWTECAAETLGFNCEEPQTMLRYSDDLGKTWSRATAITAGGDNYFPSIDTDPSTGAVVTAYYTNRFDPIFHNRQDVELDRLNPDTGRVVSRTRVTGISNEPEADPILGGFFIGDYIEVSADHGIAYVHYNANERHVKLLGEGVPIPQQDNYLTRRPE
jgi:hypothetical protein